MNNEYFKITSRIGSDDFRLLRGVVNQGIDSHLEAFTKSQFFNDPDEQGRFVFNFHTSELHILLRRLREEGSDEARQWAEDIELVLKLEKEENAS